MRIAIIVGSTRPGALGPAVGRWVLDHASARGDAEYELLHVSDFGLALLDDPVVPGAADRRYASGATRRWGETVDSFDGFVWVTPEYNHSVPAAMKNAVDVLYPEWVGKTVGFVGYGADGAVRAVEHWRGITANVRMQAVRAQVALSTFLDVTDGVFAPRERRVGELDTVLDQLVDLTGILRPADG